MKTFQLTACGKPGRFELRDLPDLQPGVGEVVVAVKACGLNHLDLWLEEAGLPIPPVLPRTPGGEVAGVVTALGAGVADWRAGDRVAVSSILFCGECEFCRAGEENQCLSGVLLGVQADGGFAEQVRVPDRALVRLPESVDFTTSAALTLAGSTAMHMLTARASVQPGQRVLVMGAASGVGSAAIQIARSLGARVITTASSEAKRQFALRLGAEHVLDTAQPNWPAEVRRLTGKRGVEVAVEHIGGEVLPKVFECVARGGTVVTCGATAGRQIQFDLWPFFVKQQRLIGSYGSSRADLRRTLAWAADGRLKPVLDAVLPLDRTAEAFTRLRAREVLGKLVIAP